MEKVGDLEMADVNSHENDTSLRNMHDTSTKTKEHEGGENHKEEDSDDSDLSADKAEELLDDPLDIVPPDFTKAKKHQDANRVKNIAEDIDPHAAALYDQEADFCE
jgi:hypothetical protein